MNEPTLILDEGGMPILEQCEGVTMPADYSFKCINNYVHCESPQYEDLQHLALGMSSHIEALRKENERLRDALIDLISIVKIHQEATKNRFAWAEIDCAEEALKGGAA